MIRISVVIPTYNPGRMLDRAVASVLEQSMPDFEVIVVDDGSADPPTRLERLDDRIRVLPRSHAGVSTARNVGVMAARSDLVAFLDHDDEWRPAKLERQLDLIERTPDSAFWCTGFDWVRDEVVTPADSTPPTYHGLLSTQTVLQSSAVVRVHDYWRVGGQNPLLAQMEDWDMFLRLLAEGRPAHMDPERLVRYHLHDTNTSRDFREAAAARFSILASHERRARREADAGALSAIERGRARTRELFAYQAVDAGRHHLANGDRRAALGHLAYGARLSPRVLAESIGRSVLGRARGAWASTFGGPDRRGDGG